MSKYIKYVAAGARTDCCNIVEKFAKLNTMRYGKYTEIWQEMKFSYIYYGHGSLEELIEFTEEVLRIAKEIWLKSELLNEQAGGLYTMYGLYLKQPTTRHVKVRLTPKDFDMVMKFHEKVKALGHLDALYVLARMFISGAFHYCISDHTYGLEKAYRRYHESDRSLSEIKDEPLYLKRLKNDDIFKQLDEAFKQYHISKCKLEGEDSLEPPSVLRLVDSQFGQELKEEFRKLTQKHDDDGNDDDDSSNNQNTETQVERGSSKSIQQVETGSSKSVPQVETGSSKSVPQVETGSSKSIPQVEAGSSKSIPQVEAGSSKSIPQVEAGSSKSLPQVEQDSSKSTPQVEAGSSKSIPHSKTSPPTDEPIKLPWWMLSVRNSYLKVVSASDSDSDSDADTDAEADADGVNNVKTSNNKGTSRRTTKDRLEALNIALGMSGDEEEEDNENEKSQNSENICEVGSSHNMPDLS